MSWGIDVTQRVKGVPWNLGIKSQADFENSVGFNLMEMGLRFHGPNPEPPNRVPRMHNVVPGARAYVAALQARLLRLGGAVRTNAAVQELLRENGLAVGVAALVNGELILFDEPKVPFAEMDRPLVGCFSNSGKGTAILVSGSIWDSLSRGRGLNCLKTSVGGNKVVGRLAQFFRIEWPLIGLAGKGKDDI